MAVSDTGHHRILFGHLVGKSFDVRHVIGRGEPGFADGALGDAALNEPRGLALSGDMLIVADCGNHAVRMIDLASGQVGTMAGTGRSAAGPVAGGVPVETALSAPWDVLLHDYQLFIAMSGSRQICRLDLKERILIPHGEPDTPQAGNRPLTLATDEKILYVADGGVGSLHAVAFDAGTPARVLVAAGSLGQPGGVAWGQGNHRLWITDGSDHRLKTMNPADGSVEAVEPFDAELDAPAGLASAGHRVYLADTNHDRVLSIDQIDKRVTELSIEGA